MPSAHRPDLDVLIPTKDRPALVERSLCYYRRIGLDLTIRILDGSDQAGARANAEACRTFGDALRIQHLACGPEISFWDRLSIGLEHTDMPYVVVTGDDDFLVPDGMRSALERLRADPAASAVVGIELRRELGGGRRSYGLPYGYKLLARPEPTLEQRLAAQAAQADRPFVTFYSVRRTGAARDMYRRMATAGFDDDYDTPFGEILDAALQLIAGRVLSVDRLIGVREHGSPIQASARNLRSPYDRVSDARWPQRVELLKTALARAIREAAGAPADPEAVSRVYVDRYLARFMAVQFSSHLSGPVRTRRHHRFVRALWPPTLLRYAVWKARGLPPAGREVRAAALHPDDLSWLRRIHAFAEAAGDQGRPS